MVHCGGDYEPGRARWPLSAKNKLLGWTTDRALEKVRSREVRLVTPDMASVPPLPRLALRRRPRRPILDPSATRCDAGVPPPRGSSDAAQPSSTLFHSPLISPPHINPLSLTTSHPFASLAGSRRHRGRPVLRPLYSRMWAVLGAMWTQREPHAQNCTLHLLGVSVLGRVAACMLVFRPAVEPCPCRAMSVRVRGACPCMAVVHLRVCT